MISKKVTSSNIFGLISCSIGLLLILLSSYVHAGAPEIKETCKDNDGLTIKTVYDSSLQVFAEAKMIRKTERERARQVGISPFAVYVNPERYYLSQYTQRWLYYRQCVLIAEFPREIMQAEQRINIDLEYQLDCRALQILRSDPKAEISYRQIQSIERDMERVLRDNRWSEILPGPERKIHLMECN